MVSAHPRRTSIANQCFCLLSFFSADRIFLGIGVVLFQEAL